MPRRAPAAGLAEEADVLHRRGAAPADWLSEGVGAAIRSAVNRLRSGQGEVPNHKVRVRRGDPPDFQAAFRRVSAELEAQRSTVERRSRELNALLESTQRLAAELDQQRLLNMVLDGATRLLHAQQAMLWLHDPDLERLKLVALADADQAEGIAASVDDLGRRLASEILQLGQPYQIEDLLGDQRWQSVAGSGQVSLRGYLGIPLTVFGDAIGLMAIFTQQPRRFADHEVELARAFAGQAAIAISNSRLYEDARRQARRLADLNTLGAMVASSLDRAEVMRRVVDAGQRLLGGRLVRLWLLDEKGSQLRLAASAGALEGPASARTELPVAGSLYGRVVCERRPVRTRDVLAEPLFLNRDLVEREGLRACLAVPVIHEGMVLGVLAVLASSDRCFHGEDADLLQALAGYAALALENARLAEEVGRLEGLRELDELKGEFLSTISHELRTPLSLIHGYAELLSIREVPADAVREMATEIHRGSTRMVRMVDELLDFSGLETGGLNLHRAPVDLGSLVESVAREIVASSPAHRLRLEIDPHLATVNADPERIRQVVAQLITNAVEYSPDGGEIVVRCWTDPKWAWVSIGDEGIGIPADEQARVFEKFYRARQSVVSPVRGAGLGLAVARHLVEAHGGRLLLESESGQGSTFSFSLPL